MTFIYQFNRKHNIFLRLYLITAFTLVTTALLPSNVNAATLTVIQITAVKNSVLELCRAGTVNGQSSSSIRIDQGTNGASISLQGLYSDKIDGIVIFSQEEWKGFKPLINSPSEYKKCRDQLIPFLLEKMQPVSLKLEDHIKKENVYNLRFFALYAKVESALSPGTLVTFDLPNSIFGTKLGMEFGWLRNLRKTSKYNTLNGIPEKYSTNDQSKSFINLRVTKYLDFPSVHPYFGVAEGLLKGRSNLKPSYPTLFFGLNSKNFLDLPLNISTEIRTLSLVLESKDVTFNNFGSGKLIRNESYKYGVAIGVSLNYQF